MSNGKLSTTMDLAKGPHQLRTEEPLKIIKLFLTLLITSSVTGEKTLGMPGECSLDVTPVYAY